MQIDSPVSVRNRIRRLLFATAVTAAALAVGSTVNAAESLQTTPPDTTPVTTPDTVTPVTTPDTIPNGGGDDSDVPWALIIAIGAVVIAVIALIATSAGRRRTSTRSAAAPPPRPSTTDQDRGYALGSAQWVHDHLAPELLAAPPAQAAQRWALERNRLDDATIRAQQFGNDPSAGIIWQRMGQALSLLGTSLDSYIQLRNQTPPNQQLINEAYAVANQHVAELGVQLGQLWPTVQR